MGKWIDGRRLRRTALWPLACLLVTAATVALATGCGGADEDSGRPARTVVAVQHVARDRWTYARERFREMCGGCHTLADARTTGKRFDLDHTGDITEERARFAIGEGEPGMPAWRHSLSRREFEELVDYVSTVDQATPGDDRWLWQIRLRTQGEEWRPEDGRLVPDGTEKWRPQG
jgi:mono/diheme cytochrome c family protein